jgi:hypothetical protein
MTLTECAGELNGVKSAKLMSNSPTALPFACPCCGFRGLDYPAYDQLPDPPFGDLGQPPYIGRFGSASFQCCACCGFEYGYDCDPDASGRRGTFRDYLLKWVDRGSHWFRSKERSENWSLERQLVEVGLPGLAPPQSG